MTEDRLREIIKVVRDLSARHVLTLPVDIEKLCIVYGARMTTLEDCEQMGLDIGRVVSCMGNRDGVATRGEKVWGIIYNKNAPINRLRFTLAEEFMHTMLGHSADRRFNAVGPTWSEELYQTYEDEAKKAADLLLIPPPVYYRYHRRMNTADMAKLFKVSTLCMSTAARFYDEYASVIKDAWGSASPIMEKVSSQAAPLIRRTKAIAVQMCAVK